MIDLTQLSLIGDGTRDIYVYELDFAGVAAAATPQSSFTVQTDSNFLWTHACFFADIAGAVQTNDSRVLPLITAMITESSSGRNLMSNPVPVPGLFGYGSEPFALPMPRFFRANAQVTVSLANFSAATEYNLRLQFHGIKFFNFGN